MAETGPQKRLSRAQREAADRAIAHKRILSNTRRLGVTTRKTLESKISEAGRERVSPRLVNVVINEMRDRGELEIERKGALGELIWLPDSDENRLQKRKTEIESLLKIFRRYRSGVSGAKAELGQRGEDMLKLAFSASTTMDYLHWGDTNEYRGTVLEQPSDGLVTARFAQKNRPILDHVALVEVKNRREWPYPENYMLWKLVRNAYKLGVVGIYFSRRIPKTTFWYAFKRVGAIGIETFNQFAEPASRAALEPVKHKYGLGFHDLYFENEVPEYLQRQVDSLPTLILSAHERMTSVRHIVEPYAEMLADKTVVDPERARLFQELDDKLKAFDAGDEEAEETDDDDDDDDGNYDDDE